MTDLDDELRQAMAAHGRPALPLYPEGRACEAPTTERIFDILADLQRHRLSRNGKIVQVFPPHVTPLQAEVIRLLGLPASAYA